MGFCSSKRWFSVPACMSPICEGTNTRYCVHIILISSLQFFSYFPPITMKKLKLRKLELCLKSEAKPGLESRLGQLQSLFFEPPNCMTKLISKLISKSPDLEP